MSIPLVVFFHRLGLKLFEVSENEEVAEFVDITSVNPPDIIENLSEFSGREVYLLASDAICHVFHHEIPSQEGHLSREFIFEQVKDKFPSHLQSSSWDYKTISTDTHTIEIIVFALTDEFQSLISNVISKLGLRIISLEPESIAVTRHSNPVLGITFGKATPPPVQNNTASNTPPTNETNSKSKIILTVIGLFVFILANFFLYYKYNQNTSNTSLTPISTVSPTPSPTLSPIVQKTWSSLSLLIENGTTKAGYAGSIAVKFEEEGIVNIKTSNASRSDYSSSKLTFKSNSLKDSYYERFSKIFSVSVSDTEVNTDLETDVVLTLGTL
ncbi:hypothetical protein HYV64_00980 [Candidatus Shapirobacteria bacterium]|nr:hypothetical protein [Candidatus Shapirobacteria bacterium]